MNQQQGIWCIWKDGEWRRLAGFNPKLTTLELIKEYDPIDIASFGRAPKPIPTGMFRLQKWIVPAGCDTRRERWLYREV